MIIGLVCLVIQIILAVQIFQRQDLDMVGKLVMALVVILVPYMIGAVSTTSTQRIRLLSGLRSNPLSDQNTNPPDLERSRADCFSVSIGT